MTVSRVVNHDSRVRQTTRERVMVAIKALDYAPNAAARALTGARPPRIALIYGNPSAAFLAEVLVGAVSEASASDMQLVLARCRAGATAADIRRLMARDQFDGVILPPPFCDSGRLAVMLARDGVPTVSIATAAPGDEVQAVMIDDRHAAQDMTRYLVELGHRRIGFITGSVNQTASVGRLEGYEAALRAAAIPVDRELIAKGDFTYHTGLRAAGQLLSLRRRPTAIFASNDDMAAAVVAVAHRAHLEVPADLSVAGFDDTTVATTISPALTTIRQPAAEMTRAAVRILAGAIRLRRKGQPATVEHRLMRHKLVHRESVGPPPAKSAA